MDLTDETLRDWRRHPHKYGATDCVMSAASHFVRLGARDAMPDFAGTYHDHDSAMDVLAGLGGMERTMEIIGGELVDGPPQRGDIIGLVTGQVDYVIPALCTGDGVAARIERGVIELSLRLVEWQGVWRGVS